tara:strand:- start:1 stop:285 length:285 start_codon:yes stop_codon:yes gene_type:complete
MEQQIQELKEELNRRKCELEGIKYAHEIEIECYQSEICDIKNENDKIQKEKKEWIGSTLKYHFLINQIKNIDGFKEESKNIVELFNDINIPIVN